MLHLNTYNKGRSKMKTKSEKNHQKKLSKLEIKYDQIRKELIDDLGTKLDLMIEEDGKPLA
jgi:hypothetical protein